MVGTASEVVGITLETKPRRKSKRNVLFDMTPSYKDGLVSVGLHWEGMAKGFWACPHPNPCDLLLAGPGHLAEPQCP